MSRQMITSLVYCAVGMSTLTTVASSDENEHVAQVPQYEVHKVTIENCTNTHVAPTANVTHLAEGKQFAVVAAQVQDVHNGTLRGQPFWEFRIAFLHLGLHQIQFSCDGVPLPASHSSKINVSEPIDAQGFIRVGANKRFFIGADGSTFVGMGLNIAWPGKKAKAYEKVVPYYEDYFKRLSAVGGNLVRLWLGPNVFAADPSKPSGWPVLPLLRSGITSIDQVKASLVDEILEAAQKYNVRILLVLESFNTLCPNFASANCKWDSSVYNTKNGGPLSGPLGFLNFWSNNEIAEVWGTYIDHVVRRWGAYRSVFAWQLFNEVDAAMYDILPSAYTWHRTMVARMRSSDPYAHMISESFGLALGNPILDHGSLFDFSSTHEYPRKYRGDQDLGTAIMGLMQSKASMYDKPAILGEFGCDDTSGGKLTEEAAHQGVWIPIFAGSAASGLPWWWDDAVTEKSVLTSARVLGQFLKLVDSRAMDLGRYHWGPIHFHNVPSTVNAVGICDKPVHTNNDISAVALLLLRAASWSRPCQPNTSSLLVPATSISVAIDDNAASWRVEWMDTLTGRVVQGQLSSQSSGLLVLDVPQFERDIVAVLSRTMVAESDAGLILGAEFVL